MLSESSSLTKAELVRFYDRVRTLVHRTPRDPMAQCILEVGAKIMADKPESISQRRRREIYAAILLCRETFSRTDVQAMEENPTKAKALYNEVFGMMLDLGLLERAADHRHTGRMVKRGRNLPLDFARLAELHRAHAQAQA